MTPCLDEGLSVFKAALMAVDGSEAGQKLARQSQVYVLSHHDSIDAREENLSVATEKAS